MRIEVPHMYSNLDDAFLSRGKVFLSVQKSPYWTDKHRLTQVTLEYAIYTGDPTDSIGTSEGILIGWMQGYGKYIYDDYATDLSDELRTSKKASSEEDIKK